jgi:Ca-activated chloride channel homolog
MPRRRRSPFRTVVVALLLAALIAGAGHALAQRTSVLLVLDASGSMYIRLADGQYRIAAAKDALTTFVSRLPDDPDLDVGLRIYGANVDALDEGACADSELVVPVAGFDRGTLLTTIRSTQARGATPIARSLELAVDDLRDVTGRAIIVLVTDGAESCGGDVRGAVERLSALGIDVDLRIIGFDLPPVIAQTFEGLGAFVNTTSATELAAELDRAVEQAIDRTDAVDAFDVHVTLTRDGEPATEGARVRFVGALQGDTYELSLATDGTFTAALPAGSYAAELADAFADEPLVIGGLTVVPDADNAFSFELALASAVTLTVDPTEPLAGTSVSVRYAGAPTGAPTWVTVVPADAPDDLYLAWAYVEGREGEASLRIPDDVTTLEARFHVELPEGGSLVVGRSAAFASRALETSLEAPAEVGVGAAFEVRWVGPDQPDDYVTIVPEGAAEGSWTSWANTLHGPPATLTAPGEPGLYEVRYVSAQSQRTLASTTVVVVAVDASLDAPDAVAVGASFEVAWQGPDNDSDYVTIVAADAPEGSYLSWAYTTAGSPATLTAPDEPGAYELRYVLGQGDRTLASRPIRVR